MLWRLWVSTRVLFRAQFLQRAFRRKLNRRLKKNRRIEFERLQTRELFATDTVAPLFALSPYNDEALSSVHFANAAQVGTIATASSIAAPRPGQLGFIGPLEAHTPFPGSSPLNGTSIIATNSTSPDPEAWISQFDQIANSVSVNTAVPDLPSVVASNGVDSSLIVSSLTPNYAPAVPSTPSGVNATTPSLDSVTVDLTPEQAIAANEVAATIPIADNSGESPLSDNQLSYFSTLVLPSTSRPLVATAPEKLLRAASASSPKQSQSNVAVRFANESATHCSHSWS